MNTNEKKALISFLSIYIGSALFLIGILFYVYYQEETTNIEKSCSMELSNVSMNIKTDILNAYMHNETYVPKKKLENKEIRYALFDENKKLIYSNLEGQEYIDFEKKFYEKDIYHFYIEKLNDPNIPIKYIVMETCLGLESIDNLKVYIVLLFLFSAVFVGFIAYFLARILLKPVREKVKHMDNFIKDSAHELNTPIAVLMTSVSMLKKGKNPEKMMKYILSSSKQISQIYNDIHFSAFDELHDSHEEEFSLNEFISDSVEYFNDISITKNITIESNLEECKIYMDKTKTQKLVNNLLSNAIKYSKANSKVEVRLKDGIFYVKDYGIGISKEEQEQIFKRYKRGENIEGGFGIGLDIVNTICKNYNLKLNLESKVEEGSTFFIDFNKIIISQ